MDFSKACSTNLQRIDDIQLLRYAVLERTELNIATYLRVLHQFRQSNVLCCEHEHELYIFDQPTELLPPTTSLVLKEEGTIQDHISKTETFDIVERLKRAIEIGVTSRLTAKGDFLKCGSWSWIQISRAATSILVEVSVTYTAPGSLSFASINREVPVSSSLCRQSKASTVLLSPTGRSAVRSKEKEHDEAATKAAQSSWRKVVEDALRCEGITIGVNDTWIAVQLADHRDITFQWPQCLCFVVREELPITNIGDSANLMDPFEFAIHWADTAEERHRALQSAPYPSAEVLSVMDDADSVTSPPFLHRPDLSNIAGVYPTPPDGMVSNISAHAALHQDILAAHTHNDAAPENNDLFRIQTNDGEMVLDQRVRQSSIASLGAIDFQQPMTDDLFGEVEFGGEQVEENDFDFFDDQDGRDLADLVLEKPTITETTSTFEERSLAISPVEFSRNSSALDYSQLSADTASHPVDTTDSVATKDESKATTPRQHLAPVQAPSILPKPLSPFDIRERLLPPPVPASISNQASRPSQTKRQNSFAPIVFNPDLRLGLKSQSHKNHSQKSTANLATTPAETPLSYDAEHGSPQHPSIVSMSSSDSDDDSPATSANTNIHTKPPTLPWHDRKRKRNIASDDEAVPVSWTIETTSGSEEYTNDSSFLVEAVLSPDTTDAARSFTDRLEDLVTSDTVIRPSLESFLEDSAKDLLMIAQLVSEQAVTCSERLAADLDIFGTPVQAVYQDQNTCQIIFTKALQEVIPQSKELGLDAIALTRDVQRAPAQLTKGQPRPPPPRGEAGPELYPIAAPHLRFNRADAQIDMLPPAIHFWEALSLGPMNGSKHIRPFFVVPSGSSASEKLPGFTEDLKAAYEGCRLGQVDTDTQVQSAQWRVELSEGSPQIELYRCYQKACMQLANYLVGEALAKPDQCFVIFMVDSSGSDMHIMCACFWDLYKSYRDSVLKHAQHAKASDLTLQLLPAKLLCSRDTFSILSSAQMATFAREIYDRCPPNDDVRQSSPLTIAVAPSLVLADALPKRINFQLTANAPIDLLHEGSELHVAYAKSTDGLWITTAWIDNTGGNHQLASLCLRGSSLAATITEIWSRTLDIIRARPVAWRVDVATHGPIDEPEIQCWRDVMRSQSQRRGALHVSLVLLEPSPLLEIRSTSTSDIVGASVVGAAITPVSTPQASSFTFSPDATGSSAPPTPAPTELNAENDTNAHLVDLPDETWAILLDPKCNLAQRHDNAGNVVTLAQGALIKHSECEKSDGQLPVLGINILFTLRIRGNGTEVDDAPVKQAVLLLKELMSAYRGLSMLTRARALHSSHAEVLPLHMVEALKGAQAMNDLLITEAT